MDFKLKSCVWELTLGCCFNCKYCGSKAGKARKNELTTEECFKVADELKDLGCRRVSLIGGEVFMRKDWNLIAKKITNNGIKCAVITNGWLFSDKELELLKECNIESVAVSLDGIPQIHDKYRAPGSFLRAMRCIFQLASNNIPVSIITTLNSENSLSIESFYDIIEEYPIFAWQIQACSPMGNAADSFDYKFDVDKIMNFVERIYKTAPFRVQLGDNIGYYSKEEQFMSFTGCSAGLDAIGIDSIGNVKGCEAMYDDYFIEGNIRERSLKDIWEDENTFSYNRKFKLTDLTGKCANCKFNCECAGGCRSYNYFAHGKMFESPLCNKPKEV